MIDGHYFPGLMSLDQSESSVLFLIMSIAKMFMVCMVFPPLSLDFRIFRTLPVYSLSIFLLTAIRLMLSV